MHRAARWLSCCVDASGQGLRARNRCRSAGQLRQSVPRLGTLHAHQPAGSTGGDRRWHADVVWWWSAPVVFAATGDPRVSPRIVDLSVTVTSETRGPPSTNVRVELEPKRRGPGFWQVSHIYESLHTGAHVDSPLHCFVDGPTMLETPLEKVIGPAALFDLSHLGANEAVTAAELERADPGLHGGQMALLHTGWTDRAYGTFPDYFTQSPYLALDGAQWLVAR